MPPEPIHLAAAFRGRLYRQCGGAPDGSEEANPFRATCVDCLYLDSLGDRGVVRVDDGSARQKDRDDVYMDILRIRNASLTTAEDFEECLEHMKRPEQWRNEWDDPLYYRLYLGPYSPVYHRTTYGMDRVVVHLLRNLRARTGVSP